MRCPNFARYVMATVGVVLASVLSFQETARADTYVAPGFSTERVLNFPSHTLVGMQFAPDGRLFIWQKNGVIRIMEPDGDLLPTPFIDLSARVNTLDDRGFWGFAFDPNFETNGYIYLSYTYENTGNPNSAGSKTSRLTRVQASGANPNVSIPGSETVILGSVGTPPCTGLPASADCIASDSGSHTIGGLHFANDGTLFVGVGDGADAAFVDPLSMRAQDLDRPEGKILRIRTDGQGLADNPFYDGNPNSWRSRIWIYGVRNPFGFTLHPATQELFFGEVGWNTWEEVNHGFAGTNFGWPCFEGNLPQPQYRAQFTTCANLSSNSVTFPFYTYDHTQGSAAIGGPIYTGTVYPPEYRDSFYFSDYSGGFIRRLVLDDQHRPIREELFADDIESAVSIAQGPDGMLYYLSFTMGELRRIRFNGVSAEASATPRHGHSPLTVQFSSAGTTNYGGGTLSYAWDFGDGTTSTAANPSHTYTSSGVETFTARLTVSNSNGGSSTSTVPVTVGSDLPEPTINLPAEGTPIKPGQTMAYSGTATDHEDGTVPPSSLEWKVLLHHNTHVHTFVGGTGASGSFVAENHGSIGSFSYEIILTATDSSGLQGSTSVHVPVISDDSPPTAPTGLTATAAGSGRVTLDWSPATDDIGITGYRVERCAGAGCTNFAEVGSPTDSDYADTAVAGSTTYRYRVRAADPSLNLGAPSNIAEATTADAPPTPAGLVGAWAFGEGFGTTTADATGNGNTGSIENATWTNQGRYGNALQFNGTSALVRVPGSASLNLPSAMTLSAWIRPTAAQGGWRTIMQRETETYFLNASNSEGALRPSGGGVIGGATQWLSGPTPSPVAAWTHVAMTYDGVEHADLRQRRPGRLARHDAVRSRPTATRCGSAATTRTASTSRASSTRSASTTGR